MCVLGCACRVAHAGLRMQSCACRYGRTPGGQNDCATKSHVLCNRASQNLVCVIRRYGRTTEGQDYWIVKNTWSPYWGIDGYIYIARDPDHDCGIATQAIYTDLRVV